MKGESGVMKGRVMDFAAWMKSVTDFGRFLKSLALAPFDVRHARTILLDDAAV
jgi:hypothetical protein